MNYALRITFSAEALRPWFSRMSMHCEKVIFYEHSDNVSRVHVHGILWGCTVSDDTFKNWIKETLHLTPVANEWSFKQTYGKGANKRRVDEGYIAYMSKGKYDPVYNKGYAEDLIAEQKAKGFDGKDDYQLSKDEALYKEFDVHMESPDVLYWINQNCAGEKHFSAVKRNATVFCMSKYRVMNQACQAKIKMLVLTYCYYYYISIPSKFETSNS